jgi:hypothetical protein
LEISLCFHFRAQVVRCCPGFPRRFAPGDFVGEGAPDNTERLASLVKHGDIPKSRFSAELTIDSPCLTGGREEDMNKSL